MYGAHHARFVLRSPYREVLIVKRIELRAEDLALVVPHAVLQDDFDFWFADPACKSMIREMIEMRYGPAPAGPGRAPIPISRQRRLLGEIFADRFLVAVLMAAPAAGGLEVETEDPKGSSEQGPVSEEKSFIAIELFDRAGLPVPNKRYRITLPDGDVREGFTDSQGGAYVGDIDPGNCKITFPEIDATEWKAA